MAEIERLKAIAKNKEQEKKIAARTAVGSELKENPTKKAGSTEATFADPNKARTELTRQNLIKSNIRVGQEASKGVDPKFEGIKKGGADQPTPHNQPKPPGGPLPDIDEGAFDMEAENRKIIEDQQALLEQHRQDSEVTRKSIEGINKQFEGFTKQWQDNQEASQMFTGQFDQYMDNFKSSFAQFAKSQGQDIDLTDSGLQGSLEELNQAKRDGLFTHKEEFDAQAQRIMEQYTQESETPEIVEKLPPVADTEIYLPPPGNSWGKTNPDKTETFDLDNNLSLTTSKSGGIDWNSVDIDRMNTVDISKLMIQMSLELTDKQKKTKLAIDDNRRDYIDQFRDSAYENRKDVFGNLLNKAALEKQKAEDEMEYQRDLLEMNSKSNIEDMTTEKDKRMSVLKGRLQAMGALESGKGLLVLEESYQKATKPITAQKERNLLFSNKLLTDQVNIGEAYVNTIEGITVQYTGDMKSIEDSHYAKMVDINNDSLLTIDEANTAKVNAISKFLGNIAKTKQDKITAQAELNKAQRDTTNKAIAKQFENGDYRYTVNQDGSYELFTDENGDYIPNADALYKYSQINNQQSTADKRLSDQSGYLYQNGQLVYNEQTGEPMKSFTNSKFTQTQNLAYSKYQLEKKYKMGMLSLNDYKAETTRLNGEYSLQQDNSGEFMYVPKRPGFNGTDGGDAKVQTFIENARNNKDDPNFKRGECGAFCNDIAKLKELGHPFLDSLASKTDLIPGMDYISPEEFAANPGEGFAVYDTGSANGHVSFVQLDDFGKPYYSDSNSKKDLRFDERRAGLLEKKIIGYHVFPEDTGGIIRTGIQGKTTSAKDRKVATPEEISGYTKAAKEFDGGIDWLKTNIPSSERRDFLRDIVDSLKKEPEPKTEAKREERNNKIQEIEDMVRLITNNEETSPIAQTTEPIVKFPGEPEDDF